MDGTLLWAPTFGNEKKQNHWKQLKVNWKWIEIKLKSSESKLKLIENKLKSIKSKLKSIESKLKSFLELIDQKNVEGGQKKSASYRVSSNSLGGALTLIRRKHYIYCAITPIWYDDVIGFIKILWGWDWFLEIQH